MLCRPRANGFYIGIWYIYGFDACYDRKVGVFVSNDF